MLRSNHVVNVATRSPNDSVKYEMLNAKQIHAKQPQWTVRSGTKLHAKAWMAVSLLAGVAFGLIHHFFYWYWNGKAVASDSQQRWIIRGGTAFAFGLKTSLAFGTSVAYVQYFWLSMASGPYKVAKINSMFTILTNAFEFRDLKLWIRLPVLAIPAIVTW
jgi:hypothetical protein